MAENRSFAARVRAAARSSWQSTFVTLAALLYARLWGASIEFEPTHRLFLATGMSHGFARAGTTVGGVFLTRRYPSDKLIRHESVHADQWARYGVTFPIRYWLEELRNPRERNRFEVDAGLAEGGYI